MRLLQWLMNADAFILASVSQPAHKEVNPDGRPRFTQSGDRRNAGYPGRSHSRTGAADHAARTGSIRFLVTDSLVRASRLSGPSPPLPRRARRSVRAEDQPSNRKSLPGSVHDRDFRHRRYHPLLRKARSPHAFRAEGSYQPGALAQKVVRSLQADGRRSCHL